MHRTLLAPAERDVMVPKGRLVPIPFVVVLVVCLVAGGLHVHINASPTFVECGGTCSSALALHDEARAPQVSVDAHALLSALCPSPTQTPHGSAITRRGPPV